MVGHGLESLLEEAVGPERAAEGVRLFRERYPLVAVEKSHLLPGVAERAVDARGAGTSPGRGVQQAAEVLADDPRGQGRGRAFSRGRGPGAATPAKPDPAMLRALMAAVGARPDETVVVGDMEVDFEFARAAGCRVVLIPGGSRTREELSALAPDAFLESIVELPEWLGVAPVESGSS